jgi:hypothetical protein
MWRLKRHVVSVTILLRGWRMFLWGRLEQAWVLDSNCAVKRRRASGAGFEADKALVDKQEIAKSQSPEATCQKQLFKSKENLNFIIYLIHNKINAVL